MGKKKKPSELSKAAQGLDLLMTLIFLTGVVILMGVLVFVVIKQVFLDK